MNDKVLEFIEKFKFSHADVLEYIFTQGNCYYFAVILKERFHGEIYYLPIENHFLCKIENNYYDIIGKVNPNEHPHNWIEFQRNDESHARRIIRDCVRFDTRRLPKQKG